MQSAIIQEKQDNTSRKVGSNYASPNFSYRYALKDQVFDPHRPLPTPTQDLSTLKGDLDCHGYCQVAEVLSNEDIGALLERVNEQMDLEEEIGFLKPIGNGSRICSNLLNKGEIFQKVALIDIIEELAIHVLGDDFILSGVTALQTLPGSKGQATHTDQGRLGFLAPIALTMNTMFMLEDFTEENGATRVIPGSHLWNLEQIEANTDDVTVVTEDHHPLSVPATGPAGTVTVWDARIVHAMGKNTSNGSRTGITNPYTRGWMQPRINPFLSISDDIMMSFPPRLREQLGYKNWNIYRSYQNGGINPPLDVVRPTDQIRELKRNK